MALSGAPASIAVDPVARQNAADAKAAAEMAAALFRQHDEHCREREARATKGRDELQGAIAVLTEKQSVSTGRIHARLDKLLWAVIGGFGALILLLGAALITIKFGG